MVPRGTEPTKFWVTIAGEMGDSLPVLNFGAGRTAKYISRGNGGGCAILDDDSLKCWKYGQFADANPAVTFPLPPPPPHSSSSSDGKRDQRGPVAVCVQLDTNFGEQRERNCAFPPGPAAA